MMRDELIQKIDIEIENAYRELADLTKRLVNIKSVKDTPVPGGPFGAGNKKVLDTVLALGEQEGFFCTDYGVGVVSAAMKEGQPDLGIWLHGDVVPEGTGWKYPPYDATELDGCIIGRGATDNKGQLAAMFVLLKIFKKLGIELSYNPAIYVGSNEETGMADLIGDPNIPEAKGFLNCCTPPRLSLVPDSGFPVGYGGRGRVGVNIKSKKPLNGITVWAGSSERPGGAAAIFKDAVLPDTLPECTVDKASGTVFAESPPIHGAHPDPNGNMITKLCGALMDADFVSAEDRKVFAMFRDISLDVYGQMLGIATESAVAGKLTVFPGSIIEVDGCPAIELGIRYTVDSTPEGIIEAIRAYVEPRGFEVVDCVTGTPAYLRDPEHPIVKTLAAIANAVMGTEKPPFILGGGTYGHRLPNAYPYGASGGRKPAEFPAGRGGAHGIDESVGIDRLQRAMRIYARALFALEEISWQ